MAGEAGSETQSTVMLSRCLLLVIDTNLSPRVKGRARVACTGPGDAWAGGWGPGDAWGGWAQGFEDARGTCM